jgi:hypothetical protein
MRSKRALGGALIALLLATVVAASLSACSILPTPTPTRTPRPTATPTPSPSPTPAWPLSIFVPQSLPAEVAAELEAAIEQQPSLFTRAPSDEEADIQLVYGSGDATAELVQWVYAVVAPFPTLVDEVAWSDITDSWAGDSSGPFSGRPLLLDAETLTALSPLLGAPGGGVKVVAPEQMIDEAWAARPSWAIVPFDRLDPRWKVLRVAGLSPLQRNLDLFAYPLVLHAGLAGAGHGVSALQNSLDAPLTNRDEARMTVVMMTGVTALARSTACTMDRESVRYPAEYVLDWLLEPDITHISNEVSFAESCIPVCRSTLVLCSRPSYIELLEYIDVDVVELTGNHLVDWGEDAMLLSLQMYDDRAIPYFGGGADLARARQPLTLTAGIHTFAFAGCNCNPLGPPQQWATEDSPGAAPCDANMVGEQLGPVVRELADSGYLPIVTLQHYEVESYAPISSQQADSRALAEAGAAIVSGSQAHQPQGFEFYAGSFIHYGLGNLFFDQMDWLETRQEFMDRHVFYDGRHISTELLTAMLEDYSRPRPMTADERKALLAVAFAASGW